MKLIVILKVIAGFIALLFAFLGLFIPVWPTTPFVLLALFLFSSTPKIKRKVLRIKIVNEYYKSYNKGQGLSKKTLITSLIFLWFMLIITMYILSNYVSFIIFGIGFVVSLHIIYISKPREIRGNKLHEQQYEK